MRKEPGLVITAVYLMTLSIASLIIYLLIYKNTGTSIDDRWWGIPLIVAATLCLIGWVLYKDKNEFTEQPLLPSSPRLSKLRSRYYKQSFNHLVRARVNKAKRVIKAKMHYT